MLFALLAVNNGTQPVMSHTWFVSKVSEFSSYGILMASSIKIKLHYLHWNCVHKFCKLNWDLVILWLFYHKYKIDFCDTLREITMEQRANYQIPCVNFSLSNRSKSLIIHSYSLNLVLCDYFLFSKLKMKTKQFDTILDI